MPITATPLTDTEIRTAKPRNKEYSLFDGLGLSLLVKPNGSKLWRYRYKHPSLSKRVLMGLGRYPAMSLAQARRKRDEGNSLLNTVSENSGLGIDPQSYWKQLKIDSDNEHNNNFEHVTRLWLEVKSSRVSKAHATDIIRSLENDVFPTIGKVPVASLTAKILIDTLKPVEKRGALETVKRLCQRINEVLSYAANTGLISVNPATGIKEAFKQPTKTNFPSIEPSELPAFLFRLAHTNTSSITRALIEWQLHTMARPSEAAGARWDEIDLENALWVIPAHRMKKQKEHIVPLSKQVLAILAFLETSTGHREHLFPGLRNPRQPVHAQTANAAIKRMGYHGSMVAHSMRSVASTVLNEHDFQPDVIEAALAHLDNNEVRRAYNRAQYLTQRREMMQWWSDFIEQSKLNYNNNLSNK